MNLRLLCDEVGILELNAGQYYGLEEIGPAVWRLTQRLALVHDVRDAIVRSYEVEESVSGRDLLALFEELVRRKIFEPDSSASHAA